MTVADEVRSWHRDHADELVGLLEALVAVESPSGVPSSQDPVRAILTEHLEQAGLRVRRVRGGQVRGHAVGDHLLGRRVHRERARAGGARSQAQLLVGHLDTVWDEGTLASMPLVRDDDRLAGPGTYDMKAGLAQLVSALRAACDLGLGLPAEPVVFVNSDEEIGSPDSTRWIRLLARHAARAFVLEGSFGLEGQLKTSRKGVGRFVVRAKGTAAHAGLDPEHGRSAVLEISLQIQQLFALNDPGRGVTVNVGTVDGGLRPNVIAPEASCEVDCRVLTLDDARSVERSIRRLTPSQDGVILEIEGGFGRLPMEPTPRNRALWEQARHAADGLGLDLDEASVGGASDGNTTSLFTATLDGLGAVGEGAHAAHEHVLVSHLPERAALLTMLLASPVAEPA